MEFGIVKKVKVLWFVSHVDSVRSHEYFGCGWIDGLRKLLIDDSTMELNVAYFDSEVNESFKIQGVKYWPVYRPKARVSPIDYVLENYILQNQNKRILRDFRRIVDLVNPDIIHVFGTEDVFGLFQNQTQVPVLIQIQGNIYATSNTYFPPAVGIWDFVFNLHFFSSHLFGRGPIQSCLKFKAKVKTEEEILSNSRFVTGRTLWDSRIQKLFAKDAKYFHLNEVLRDEFYLFSDSRRVERSDIFEISSNISGSFYKGLDVILKCAQLLRKIGFQNFQWRVIGISRSDKIVRFFEEKYNIVSSGVNVVYQNKVPACDVIELISNSKLYVHPSYIENSSNSICEAQLLGVPVIAANVGGISSIIENEVSGFLFPSNDIIGLAALIVELSHDNEKLNAISAIGMERARIRHNRESILNELKNIYKQVISDEVNTDL